MHMLFAIIKPFKLDDVKEALTENGVYGITVFTDIKGHARQKGHSELYRGAEYVVDFLPKTGVMAIVPDDRLERIKKEVIAAAKTGKFGDGIIWSIPVESYTRIRTEEIITNEKY